MVEDNYLWCSWIRWVRNSHTAQQGWLILVSWVWGPQLKHSKAGIIWSLFPHFSEGLCWWLQRAVSLSQCLAKTATHSLSLHVPWASLQYGGWVPKESARQGKPGRNYHLYGLPSGVTFVDSINYAHRWGPSQTLPHFKGREHQIQVEESQSQQMRSTYVCVCMYVYICTYIKSSLENTIYHSKSAKNYHSTK